MPQPPPSAAELEYQLEIERLRHAEREKEAERSHLTQKAEAEAARVREERQARERTVQSWREEERRRRQERKERRQKRWKCLGDRLCKRPDSAQGPSGTLRVLAALGIPATAALVIFALAVDGDGLEVFAIGLLTATAAFATGALIGFIFGIPRSAAAKVKAKEAGDEAKPENEKTADEKNAETAQRFLPNTNLEEISDWLTKILVGVGLVQIHEIGGAVDTLASGLEADLGGGSQGYAVAVTLLVAFSITGFVGGYLFTRLRLHPAFEQALAAALTVVRKEVRQEARAGDQALALVEQQLSPGEIDQPAPATLIEALKAATPGVRSQAFFRARDQRRKNWRGPRKEYVAPTIPIFEALIACDPEGHYHRTRAELGYALKDQEVADLVKAKAALDEAIRLRPETDLDWTRMYELNRAYCNILLDPLKDTQTPSAEEVTGPIVADLLVAAGSEEIRQRIRKGGAENAPITKWLSRNGSRADVQAVQNALKTTA